MDSDEVRKRKEYAEKKVKERHAALRKEAEERRKQSVEHRERVQSVLKREQVLLQKRMQQLNEDEERKKATLAKQHEATSRIAAITKSPKSFAFGSSTPRTLAYLDNLPKSEQQYDKKLRPLEESSQGTSPTSTSSTTKMGRITSTPQRPPPAAHRPAPAMTSMTSSMYVTSSAPPTRHAKTIVKATTTTTTTSKRLSHGPSMMTQSVYTPSRPATTSRLSMGGPRQNRVSMPSSARPTHSMTSTPASANTRRSLDTRKPPMPRKSAVGAKRVETTPVVVQEEKVLVETAETAPIIKELASKEEVVREESPAPNAQDYKEETVAEHEEVVVLSEPEEIQEAKVEAVETPVELGELVGEVEEEKLPEHTEAAPIEPERVEQAIPSVEVVEDVVPEQAENTPSPAPVEEEQVSAPIPESPKEPEHVEVQAEKEELLHEETSESHLGSTANTSLADELINIGADQNDSNEMPSKPEVIELEYPLLEEQKKELPNAANDLVDVFGNDFLAQNRPNERIFDEDTDSGKASPTSSETSSTTDEVTPRSVIEEVKIAAAPRVLPIVRSAEDMARKEKEAREAEERKNRLAAILAKSRGMASPMTNTLPPTAADIKDSSSTTGTTSPPLPPSPLPVEQPTSSSSNALEETAVEKATTNESGKANDVLARVAAMTNSSTLQKILQRKQGSNPSLQTSESTGGEIY